MMDGPLGLNPRSVERALAAIAYFHRLHGYGFDRRHPTIVRVVSRATRIPFRQARALTSTDLNHLLGVCDETLAGVRARALILTGFVGCLRRSELCAIQAEHLVETRTGLNLFLPLVEGDQGGEGLWIGLARQKTRSACPVAALQTWMHRADIEAGPVFRPINRHGAVELTQLTPQSVNIILKNLAKRAGFSDAEVAIISSHSLRTGYITTAYEEHVPEHVTQRRSRHKSVDVLRRCNRATRSVAQTISVGSVEDEHETTSKRPTDGYRQF
jgi:integrase